MAPEAHLDPDTLAAYVDGRLAVGELDRADRHIDACGTCRRELSALAAIDTRSSQPRAKAEPVHPPEGKLGRYDILRELGRGAMGIVLRAYDPELARPVAIKLLRDVDPSTRELMRTEARALAKLRHPNVVTVYDVILEDDRMYIAMELVEGDTLRGYCKGRSTSEVLAACVRAGRGLAAAHDAGVIHRDFKPDNVLCTADGEARVSDFGLAQTIDDTAGDGAFCGTPAYMAPEVLRKQPATPASDQYSYCVSVYEMLVGKRPDADDPPTKPPMPAWVWRALERGLSRDPAGRFASVHALVDALADDPRVRRRRRATLGAGAAVALATGAFAVYFASPSAPSCAIDERALGNAWDSALREQVRSAVGAAAGEDVAKLVIRGLDEYAALWIATRRDACMATHIRGEQSELALERRVACLDRGRRELVEVVRVLASADTKTARAAQEAIVRLRDPGTCRGTDAGDRPASDVLQAVIADRVRAGLDSAWAHYYLGKLDDARLRANDALDQLAVVDLPRLRAEALHVVARIHADQAQHDRAEATLFDALHAAQRARDDVAVAAIWIDIVLTTGAFKQRFDLAISNARAADAALARVDTSSDLRLRHNYSVGSILLAHGKLDEARERFEAALANAPTDPRRRPDVGLVHVALCDTYRQLGKRAEARRHCHDGIGLLEAALGRDHQKVAIAVNILAAIAFDEADLATAQQLYERVIAIFEKRGIDAHLSYALAQSNLGAVYSSRDQPDRARVLFERALATFEAHYPKHPQRLFPLQGLAGLAFRLGDVERAVRYYEQVREVSAATYAAESPALAMADFNLALAYRSAKQPDRAQAILDPLIARMLVPGKESWTLAARAIDLAGTLADDRRDYRAAIALRERALAALSHIDDPANLAYLQLHGGETYTHMKRPDLAISPLEAALAYYAARSDEPYESGVTRYLLAKALWESGRDRPRSMALAKQADDDLARAKSGDELQMFRDEVDRFLATHR